MQTRTPQAAPRRRRRLQGRAGTRARPRRRPPDPWRGRGGALLEGGAVCGWCAENESARERAPVGSPVRTCERRARERVPTSLFALAFRGRAPRPWGLVTSSSLSPCPSADPVEPPSACASPSRRARTGTRLEVEAAAPSLSPSPLCHHLSPWAPERGPRQRKKPSCGTGEEERGEARMRVLFAPPQPRPFCSSFSLPSSSTATPCSSWSRPTPSRSCVGHRVPARRRR